MYSDNQLKALRKLYTKNLWTYIGVSVLSVAAAFFLVYSPMVSSDSLIPWLIAAGVGLTLSAAEYAAERALYKRGTKADLLLFGFVLGVMLLWIILSETGVLGGYTYLFFPVILGFLFNRPLIPAIGLLRDRRRLSDGSPCEAVGRMKSGTTRRTANVGKESYLLFEDELTGEVRLLLMGSMDPARRYRVLYLPRSGLAVGEVVPDHVTFDPFGNPVERETDEDREFSAENSADKPAYTEDTYAEDDSAEPAYSTATPTAEELDPNSPARRKAAKFALASKLCIGLCIVSFGLSFLIVALNQGDNTSSASFVLISLCILLGFTAICLSEYFKKQDRKLRCTRRTTARCVDTVHRKSGKHSSTLHPIVGFEVDGVSYTAELSISCSHSSVGELYTICYDPLDPESVRPA